MADLLTSNFIHVINIGEISNHPSPTTKHNKIPRNVCPRAKLPHQYHDRLHSHKTSSPYRTPDSVESRNCKRARSIIAFEISAQEDRIRPPCRAHPSQHHDLGGLFWRIWPRSTLTPLLICMTTLRPLQTQRMLLMPISARLRGPEIDLAPDFSS